MHDSGAHLAPEPIWCFPPESLPHCPSILCCPSLIQSHSLQERDQTPRLLDAADEAPTSDGSRLRLHVLMERSLVEAVGLIGGGEIRRLLPIARGPPSFRRHEVHVYASLLRWLDDY